MFRKIRINFICKIDAEPILVWRRLIHHIKSNLKMNLTQNKKIIGGIAVALAIVLSGGWWFWGGAKAEPTEQGSDKPESGRRSDGGRPTPVLTVAIKNGDLRVIQTSIGTVIPSSMLTLRSRVNGQLIRVLLKEGQTDHSGDLLAEIDPRPFQAQLTQTEGQALRDQALLKNAQLDLERYKTLQSQDSIAAQQVDAQAALVQQYQGTVLTDKGLVENAKLQLDFTRITSPISGRIGLRQIDVGNNITTTDTLSVINAISPINVVFTLPEDRASNIAKRQRETRLPVEAWDRGNTTLLAKGELLSVDNQIDPTSGTIKLKAQFTNNDAPLFPNQFVNIHLLSDTLKQVVVAPSAAIQHGSIGSFVYLVDGEGVDAKVTLRPVVPGASDGDTVSIEKGLLPGDKVVVSGIDRLRDGARVVLSSNEGNDKSGRHGGKQAEGAKQQEGTAVLAEKGRQPVDGGGQRNRPALQPQS
jgi:multidrug efflux system membrane fusion protein